MTVHVVTLDLLQSNFEYLLVASLNLTLGLLLLALLNLKVAILKTSGNALTLLLIDPLSNLFVTATTTVFLRPKTSTTLT